MHPRTLIRNAFLERLMDNTLAQENVYDSRTYPFDDNLLPAIIIFSKDEQIVTRNIGKPLTLTRELKVAVECYVKSENMAHVVIDSMANSIEELILFDPTLSDLCKSCWLDSTSIDLNSDAEKPIAVGTLNFLVTYQTNIYRR